MLTLSATEFEFCGHRWQIGMLIARKKEQRNLTVWLDQFNGTD